MQGGLSLCWRVYSRISRAAIHNVQHGVDRRRLALASGDIKPLSHIVEAEHFERHWTIGGLFLLGHRFFDGSLDKLKCARFANSREPSASIWSEIAE
jgi:hypothetical protein